jgi:hypothetical protein
MVSAWLRSVLMVPSLLDGTMVGLVSYSRAVIKIKAQNYYTRAKFHHTLNLKKILL